jgi:hypothetical protein
MLRETQFPLFLAEITELKSYRLKIDFQIRVEKSLDRLIRFVKTIFIELLFRILPLPSYLLSGVCAVQKNVDNSGLRPGSVGLLVRWSVGPLGPDGTLRPGPMDP